MDLSSIHATGWAHLAYFGLFIPVVAEISRRKLRRAVGPPDRLATLRAAAWSLILFALISVATAWVEWIPLVPKRWPSAGGLVLGVGVLGLMLGIMWPNWRRAVDRDTGFLRRLMPVEPAERRLWLLVSLMAGVGEEITWRGVQYVLLLRLLGDPWTAALVASVQFGLAHLTQGWRAAVLIFCFALGFHGLAIFEGNLSVAMGVHAAYDVVVGLTLGRLIRRREAAGQPVEAVELTGRAS